MFKFQGDKSNKLPATETIISCELLNQWDFMFFIASFAIYWLFDKITMFKLLLWMDLH